MDKKDLTEQEEQEIVRYIEADKPLPDKYRSLLSDDKRENIRVRDESSGEWEERWTRDFVFENEWPSHYTKTDRSIELTSAFYECTPSGANWRSRRSVSSATTPWPLCR